MIYAIKDSTGNIVFQQGQDIPAGAAWPVGDFINTPTNLLVLENSKLRFKTQEELKAESDAAISAQEQAALEELYRKAQEDITFENDKSPSLKALENIYIDFLTNMWTPALVDLGLIPPDKTITVNNTDEPTNMYLLMQMRTINYTKYDQMASEFLRLKSAIVENGGVMSKITSH